MPSCADIQAKIIKADKFVSKQWHILKSKYIKKRAFMAEDTKNKGGNIEEQRKSRRDTFRENFSTRHPDVNMDDEEAYYAALDDEYNSRDEELNRYRANNEKLNNMFLENPQAAYFMNDLLDGKKQMGVALMEHFGDLFKDAVNDPTAENVKAFADALDEHAKRIKENDELQAQFERNVDNSETTIENWQSAHNATPEQVDAMREFINTQFGNLVAGIITPEMLDFAYKGLNYDKDVAAAEESGQAAGRTQRIKEKVKKGKGDGMPMIPGGGQARTQQRDGFLANATRSDPWESAKREKY